MIAAAAMVVSSRAVEGGRVRDDDFAPAQVGSWSRIFRSISPLSVPALGLLAEIARSKQDWAISIVCKTSLHSLCFLQSLSL